MEDDKDEIVVVVEDKFVISELSYIVYVLLIGEVILLLEVFD